jgi:hypothetical protein
MYNINYYCNNTIFIILARTDDSNLVQQAVSIEQISSPAQVQSTVKKTQIHQQSIRPVNFAKRKICVLILNGSLKPVPPAIPIPILNESLKPVPPAIPIPILNESLKPVPPAIPIPKV